MSGNYSWRGLLSDPVNRDGVIFLFSRVAEELNIYVREITGNYPSGRALRYTGRGWKEVSLEFVYRSSDIKNKGFATADGVILICWEHDWNECPLEVIELADRLVSLPENTPAAPDAAFESSLAALFDLFKVNENIRRLWGSIDRQIRETDALIWAKTTDECVVYYSPARPFLFAYPKPKLINIRLFSGDEVIEGVRYPGDGIPGGKWGYINLDYSSIPTTLHAVRESFRLTLNAVRDNRKMGCFIMKPVKDKD